MNKTNNDSGKILLASLAGLGAGIIAGVLLAPEDGRASRENVMRGLTDAGDELNRTLKRWTANLKASTGQGQSSDDDEIVLQGSWEDVKGQMQRNYDEIIDEIAEEDPDNQRGR